jgi:GNAT superfamily N-acetyltransferase
LYTKLDDVKLKSNERMEIGVVGAPDAEYAQRLHDHLKHKGDPWIWHVDKALQSTLDDLETRFYIGKLGDEIASSVMIVSHARVGILGHVFTKEHHRRKGAYRALMAMQMEDCRARDLKVLYLGTGYDSPAYHIYHSFGFRSVADGSGSMRFTWDDMFEENFLSGVDPYPEPAKWHHWPTSNVLTMQKTGDVLRSVSLGLFGFHSVEGVFLRVKREIEQENDTRCNVLATSNGAAVGIATIRPDPRWKGHVNLLDLYVHPNFSAKTRDLINSLTLPPGKTQCYADGSSHAKIAALEQCGFWREGLLERQICHDDEPLDVMLYCTQGETR